MDHRVATLFLTQGEDEAAFKDALEKRRTVGLFRDTFFGTRENVQTVMNAVLKMSFTKYSPSEFLIGNSGEMEIANAGPIDVELEIVQPDFRLLNYPRFVKIPHGSKVTLKALRKKYDELAPQSAWTASWGRTNRLVVGPFASFTRARTLETKLKGEGADVFAWQSDAGEVVERLSGE